MRKVDLSKKLSEADANWLRSWNRGDEVDANEAQFGKAGSASVAPADGDGEGDEESVDYSELSVADLKAELKERGLSVSGSKDDLVNRLEEDDAEEE